MDSERTPARRRPLFWMIAGLALVAVVVAITFAARRAGGNGSDKKKKDGVAAAAPVELAEVRSGRISTFLQNTASLEARNSATLVARRRGQVTAILVEEGAWVERGQALARLDDSEERLKVQRTELAAEMAKRDLERGKDLGGRGYLSAKEQDDLEVTRRNAWVELEQARFELSQMSITAPFSGRVVERKVNLGETLTEGRECFRLDDFDPILARVYFPERELRRVQPGQPAIVTLDAHPGETFAARVSLVNPVVDRSNGTFKVTLEIPNPKGQLRPGTFARIQIKTGEFPSAILVPRRSLLQEDGDDYVFVARGDSAVRVRVDLGAIEGDTAQILGGLAPGERVVTVGQGGLKQGARIKPVAL